MGIVNVGSTLGGLAGGAATARLLVVISGNTAGLEQALARAQGASTGFASGFAKNSNAIGNSLIRGVTLPTLALGGISLKMAADFESAMGRVRGLTTLTAGEAAEAEQKIMELASTFPTAPTELADALYFAGSAGLEASEAMQVVEYSAGAAAIGMGEANDVAKTLIFSMNAYESAGLTAARAMDVFTAAIKAGTADPDELALALGRVLPVAEEAGVAFEEVVGSIAALTNIGLPTRVAATSLRALFGGFLAPTIQAQEQLEALGVTSDDLRSKLSEGGPLAAMDWIKQLAEDAGAGGEEVRRRLIPQIRAFTAALGLAGDRAGESRKIFDMVLDSTGAYDKALGEISKTINYRFGVALNQLRITAIETGTALFPVFEELMRVVGALGMTLGGIPGPLKSVSAAMMVALAAAGPLTKIYAQLTNQGAGLFTSWKGGAMAAGVFAMSLGLLMSGMGALARGEGNLMTVTLAAAGAFGVARIALGGLLALANSGALGWGRFAQTVMMSQGMFGPIAAGLAIVTAGVGFFLMKSKEAEKQAEGFRQALVGLGADASATRIALRDIIDDAGGIGTAFTKAMTAADAWGLSVSDGVQAARGEIPALISDVLRASNAFNNPDLRPKWRDEIVKALPVLSDIEGKSVDVGRAFEEAGIDVESLKNAIGSTGDLDPFTDLLALSGELKTAYETMDGLARGRILTSMAEQSAQQSLAEKYGVTADAVTEALGQYNMSAQGLSKSTQEMLAREMGWVNAAGEVVGAAALRRQALEQYRTEALESLTEDFLGAAFQKEVATVKGSTGELVANLGTQIQALEDYANAVGRLQSRGVDTNVLSFLVEQGPAMVRKFAGASDAELKQLESYYYRSLGAIDDAILREADHQEFKGSLMGKSLARGIQRVKGVPQKATNEVLGRISAAMSAGDFSGKGRKAIIEMATGMAQASGVPKAKVDAIVRVVLNALGSAPPQARAHGAATGGGYADGIQGAQGSVSAAAGGLKGTAVGGLSGAVGAARSLGLMVGQSFAGGIAAASGAVASAVASLIAQARGSADKNAKNSPKYFTYYLGQDLTRQMAEGIARGNPGTVRRPSVEPMSRQTRGLRGAGGGGTRMVTENNYIIYADSFADGQKIRKELVSLMRGEDKVQIRHSRARGGNRVSSR